MVLSVALHIGAMFPAYPGSPPTPVASSPSEAAIYICLEVGWALAAVLVLGRISVRGGIALGAGLGAVELGFLVTDVASGFLVSNGAEPGVWLALAGLGAGLAGVLYGAGSLPAAQPRQASGPRVGAPWALVTALVGAVAVAAFWPSWDSYHLVGTSGQTLDITMGNAFSQPGAIMAGEIMAGLAIGTVVIIAAFWVTPTVGAWAIGGVVIALGSQVVSGVVQAYEPLTETLGTANTQGLDLARSTLSLTAYWVIDVVALVALAALAVRAGLAGRKLATGPGLASGGATGNDWPPAQHWPSS